jgi:hypothetical protein
VSEYSLGYSLFWCETNPAHPPVPKIVLGTPVNKQVWVDTQLKNQLTKYFAVACDKFPQEEILKQINFDLLIRYGRLRITDGGDHVCTASAVDANMDARNNSHIKVCAFLYCVIFSNLHAILY